MRNPSAPSSEEVWQSLRDYRAGIPERLAHWKQAELASQETLAQVEQHEPSSRDMTGLPLDGLVTLGTHDENISINERDFPTHHFWLHLSPTWLQLQRVRLGPLVTHGFIGMLLEDDGGCERLLLPSLTVLAVVDFSFSELLMYPLYDALKKRVEQRVPVRILNLRMCTQDGRAKVWLRSLTELVVDILGPEESTNDNFGEDDHSDTGSGDEDE